jgi:hypothetical protein
MRKYIVTFWDSAKDGWPLLELKLKEKNAAYTLIPSPATEVTVVVECSEETALLIRDSELVMTLLALKKPSSS